MADWNMKLTYLSKDNRESVFRDIDRIEDLQVSIGSWQKNWPLEHYF